MQWLHDMHEFVSFNQAVHLKYRIWKSMSEMFRLCTINVLKGFYMLYRIIQSHYKNTWMSLLYFKKNSYIWCIIHLYVFSIL